MFRSKTGGIVELVLAAALSLMLIDGNHLAQGGDPIEEAIDRIVKESSPEFEKPKAETPSKDDVPKASDTSNAAAKVEMLPGGIKLKVLPNGTKLYTRPDGTRQYVTQDGNKLTIRPDGERILERPGQTAEYRPPKIDDPDDYRPHHRPEPPPPPSTSTSTSDRPLPEFHIREQPESVGKHATWEDLARSPFDSTATSRAVPEDRARYTPPPPGTDDELLNRSLTFGKTSVFTYKSGGIQTVLPDGRTVTTYPGIPEAVLTDPSGKQTRLTPEADGGIRVSGGESTVMIDPATGRNYIQYGNGLREVVNPDGTTALSDGRGGREWRDESGRPIESTLTDSSTGYSVRQWGNGPPIILKDGQPVGIGTREGFNILFRDKNGQDIRINELFDRNTTTLAGRTIGNAGYYQPERTGQKPNLAPAATIFDLIRPQLQRLQQQGDLRSSAVQAELEKLKALEKAAKESAATQPGSKPEDALDRAMKLSQATLRKSELEDQFKRVQDQMAAQKTSLEQEKARVDDQKADLLLRETRASNMSKDASSDLFSINQSRAALSLRRTTLQGAEGFLQVRERTAKGNFKAALAKIDYSRYDRCPNKEPWKECGHGDVKRKWLNDQLAAILGPSGVAELKKVSQERAELNKQKQDLKEEEAALDQKEASAKKLEEKADSEREELKRQRHQLDSTSRQIQQQIEQTKSQVDAMTKQIAEQDALIKKYSTSSTP